MNDTKYKVAVTLVIRDKDQSFWENGIFQNAVYLAMLLAKAPNVSRAYLAIGGAGDEEARDQVLNGVMTAVAALGLDIDIITVQEAATDVDVIIELCVSINNEQLEEFRAHGGKLVSMHVGNDYYLDAERIIFDKPHAYLVPGTKYDDFWTIPEYELTSGKYLGSVFNIKTKILPHLWHPIIFDMGIAVLDQGTYGYAPGTRSYNVAVFEPNLSTVKTSFIPLLACEVANSINPKAINIVFAFNSAPLGKHANMLTFCNSLDLHTQGKISYDQRQAVYKTMLTLTNCVVSHQVENAQNYLYYEILYGNYPLIHNSPIIKECGYYYEDFNSEQAGYAILQALAQHDGTLEQYKVKSAVVLESVNPLNETNIKEYNTAITDLFTT